MGLQTENKPLTMAEQVRAANAEARKTAATGEGGNANGTEIEAPAGGDGVTPDDSTEGVTTDESTENTEVVDPVVEEEESPIRIGDQTFKTEKEAIAYAEKMERERLVEQAQAQGMREAIEAMKPPVVPVEEPDNFEEEFYGDPKKKIKQVKSEAIAEALALFRAEQREEKLWAKFLDDHPDLDRVDAERILQANWSVLGKMTDTDLAMKELARKTRAEYQRIAERMKPRTELPPNKRQALGAGSPTRTRGVTPTEPEKPVDFVTQMRRLKSNG
jgi:hypothetical protein